MRESCLTPLYVCILSITLSLTSSCVEVDRNAFDRTVAYYNQTGDSLKTKAAEFLRDESCSCSSDTMELAIPISGCIEDKITQTFSIGDFKYEVQYWDTTLVNISLSPQFYLQSGIATQSDRMLTIPSKVCYNGTTYKVYGVDNFNDCPYVETFILEDGIESISGQAFTGCRSLKEIRLPASFSSIVSGIFAGCDSLASIVIDKSNPWFFSPKGSKAIVGKADSVLVAGCGSTVITSDVRVIGEGAFSACTNLTDVIIPEGVISIQDGAFEDCINMKRLTLPMSLRNIGNFAFRDCTSLDSLYIPSGLTNIYGGGNAFARCTALRHIHVSKENKVFDSRDSCNAIIKTATNTLQVGCKSTFIPTTVRTLSDSSFSGHGLTSINIPSSVDSIEIGAFIDCPTLVEMTVAPDNSKYDSRGGCNAIIETATDRLIAGCNATSIPCDIKRIGAYAMAGVTTPPYLSLPSGLKEIAANAFAGCDALEYAYIPSSVTTMESGIFKNCKRLKSVVVDALVDAIPDLMFANCPALTHVTINNKATKIGFYAFWNCRNLSRLILPQTTKDMKVNTFKGCALEDIIDIPTIKTK